MSNKASIDGIFWLNTRDGLVGIVLRNTGFEKTAYVKVVDGHDQDVDAQSIVDWGNTFPLSTAKAIVEYVEPQNMWLDPEKQRPHPGQSIIFNDAVGMFKGNFHTLNSGVVYVEGKAEDSIAWEDIHEWVPYPNTPE